MCRAEAARATFWRLKAKGHIMVGITSYQEFPGKILNPHDDRHTTKQDQVIHGAIEAWLHCFRQATAAETPGLGTATNATQPKGPLRWLLWSVCPFGLTTRGAKHYLFHTSIFPLSPPPPHPHTLKSPDSCYLTQCEAAISPTWSSIGIYIACFPISSASILQL
jgi:hypothetical protein